MKRYTNQIICQIKIETKRDRGVKLRYSEFILRYPEFIFKQYLEVYESVIESHRQNKALDSRIGHEVD